MNKTFFIDKENHAKSQDEVCVYISTLSAEKDFEVEIRTACKKRSAKQLKAYWRLVDLITNYMNQQGNLFGREQVSNWIKIQAGHYCWVEGEKLAKSIADRSSATVFDMTKIIDFILAFGIEHNIRGCEISNAELDAMLRFYGGGE